MPKANLYSSGQNFCLPPTMAKRDSTAIFQEILLKTLVCESLPLKIPRLLPDALTLMPLPINLNAKPTPLHMAHLTRFDHRFFSI